MVLAVAWYRSLVRRQKFRDFLESLQDEADSGAAPYFALLKAKLDAAEADVREGRLVPHDEVVARCNEWFAACS